MPEIKKIGVITSGGDCGGLAITVDGREKTVRLTTLRHGAG